MRRTGSLVFAGGVGLAAYQAGTYEAFARSYQLASVAGSSAGAVTASLIVGNREDERLARLRSYWDAEQDWSRSRTTEFSWLSVIQARLIGKAGQFSPRPFVENLARFQSVYDLKPLRGRLERLIDFGRLNSGEIRLCIATTDLETGEVVLFDTAAGDRISVEHILASCGYIPEFPALQIGGKLLGDGGLSVNAPFEPLLEQVDGNPLFIVDLYPRETTRRPDSFMAAVERRNDLMFGNQTFLRLQARLKDKSLPSKPIFLLSYSGSAVEPGAEKPFDLSVSATRDRWAAGLADMEEAVRLAHAEPDCGRVIAVRRHS